MPSGSEIWKWLKWLFTHERTWIGAAGALIGTVGGSVVLGLVDLVFNTSALTWVWSFLPYLGMSVSLPLGLVIVLGLLAVAWLGVLTRRYYLEKEPQDEEPHEEQFTETQIDNIRWQWSWEDGTPRGLTPLCPECGMEMNFEDGTQSVAFRGDIDRTTFAECPNGHVADIWENKTTSDVINLIQREVERRVREDEWEKE